MATRNRKRCVWVGGSSHRPEATTISAKGKNTARTTNDAQTVQLAAATASDNGQKMRIGVGHQFVSRADRAKGVTTFPVPTWAQPVPPHPPPMPASPASAENALRQ